VSSQKELDPFFERKLRSFERLLVAPIRIEQLITAKISGAILFGIFNSIIPVLFSALYFNAIVANLIFTLTFIQILFKLNVSTIPIPFG
jgi:ABC-type Na+ efflux pump permease subunit